MRQKALSPGIIRCEGFSKYLNAVGSQNRPNPQEHLFSTLKNERTDRLTNGQTGRTPGMRVTFFCSTCAQKNTRHHAACSYATEEKRVRIMLLQHRAPGALRAPAERDPSHQPGDPARRGLEGGEHVQKRKTDVVPFDHYSIFLKTSSYQLL